MSFDIKIHTQIVIITTNKFVYKLLEEGTQFQKRDKMHKHINTSHALAGS